MHEEQIVRRAHHEVAARRAARPPRSQGLWALLLPAITLSVVMAFLAAPGPLPSQLLIAMSGVCGLRPAHSYFAGDLQLPLESRMVGIYGGFLLTVLVVLVFRRVAARRPGGVAVMIALALMFGSMVFDGINSTLHEVGLPYLYQPTNLLRLVTGLLSGIAIAPVVVWLLATITLPPHVRRKGPVVRSLWELVGLLALCGVFAMLVLQERATLYYPIAALSVGGVVLLLACAVLIGILVISRLNGRIRHIRQLIVPGALALLLTFALLAGMAALRWMVTGSFV